MHRSGGGNLDECQIQHLGLKTGGAREQRSNLWNNSLSVSPSSINSHGGGEESHPLPTKKTLGNGFSKDNLHKDAAKCLYRHDPSPA